MGRVLPGERRRGRRPRTRQHHVQQTFGVDLETFEERVVNWSSGEEAERIFAGNFRAVRRSMERVTEVAEE